MPENKPTWTPSLGLLPHRNSDSEEHQQIAMALNHGDAQKRYNAISHPKATAEHIAHALGDRNVAIRLQAIKHPN